MESHREPVFMPARSVLHLTGWFDNSADNPYNPDPTVDVPWGLPTQMEMLTGRVFVARAQPLHHVVGRDPIPEYVLQDAERYRRQVVRAEHGVTTNLVTSDGIIDLTGGGR